MLLTSSLGVWLVPGCAPIARDEVEDPFWDPGVIPLVSGEDADSSDGREVTGIVDPPTVLPVTGEAAPPAPPSLLPMRTFRLLSSVPSSFNLFSLPSLAPSRAFGMLSFRALTSSLIRRVSSSLRRVDDFNSETTFSTSRRAASRRSVRASSADFSVAVSEESWSIRANARENCSSMFSLSC